jgi:hypothetical protein
MDRVRTSWLRVRGGWRAGRYPWDANEVPEVRWRLFTVRLCVDRLIYQF